MSAMADLHARAVETLPGMFGEALLGLLRGWSYTPLAGKVPILPGWTSREWSTVDELDRW